MENQSLATVVSQLPVAAADVNQNVICDAYSLVICSFLLFQVKFLETLISAPVLTGSFWFKKVLDELVGLVCNVT